MLDTVTTRRVLLRGLVLLAVTVGAARLASATVPNLAICTAAYNQMAPSAVSNGAGGALVAWTDLRWPATLLPLAYAVGFAMS